MSWLPQAAGAGSRNLSPNIKGKGRLAPCLLRCLEHALNALSVTVEDDVDLSGLLDVAEEPLDLFLGRAVLRQLPHRNLHVGLRRRLEQLLQPHLWGARCQKGIFKQLSGVISNFPSVGVFCNRLSQIRKRNFALLILRQALIILVEDGVGLPAEMLDELNVRLEKRAAEIYSLLPLCYESRAPLLIEEVCRDMRDSRRQN